MKRRPFFILFVIFHTAQAIAGTAIRLPLIQDKVSKEYNLYSAERFGAVEFKNQSCVTRSQQLPLLDFRTPVTAPAYTQAACLELNKAKKPQLSLDAMVARVNSENSAKIRLVLKNIASAPVTVSFWSCSASQNFVVLNGEPITQGICTKNVLRKTTIKPEETVEYYRDFVFHAPPKAGKPLIFTYLDEDRSMKPVMSQPLDVSFQR